MRLKEGLLIISVLAIGSFGFYFLKDLNDQQLAHCMQKCDGTMSECLEQSPSEAYRRPVSCETHHYLCNMECGAR